MLRRIAATKRTQEKNGIQCFFDNCTGYINESMNFCPTCGVNLKESCPLCNIEIRRQSGTRHKDIFKCPNCHGDLKFCKNCGRFYPLSATYCENTDYCKAAADAVQLNRPEITLWQNSRGNFALTGTGIFRGKQISEISEPDELFSIVNQSRQLSYPIAYGEYTVIVSKGDIKIMNYGYAKPEVQIITPERSGINTDSDHFEINPVIINGLLLINAGCNIFYIDLITGDNGKLLDENLSAPISSPIGFNYDNSIIAFITSDNVLYRYDFQQLMHFELAEIANTGNNSIQQRYLQPLFAGNSIYALSAGNNLNLINGKNIELLTDFSINTRDVLRNWLFGEDCLIATSLNCLYIYDLPGGKGIRSEVLRAQANYPPVYSKNPGDERGFVYICTESEIQKYFIKNFSSIRLYACPDGASIETAPVLLNCSEFPKTQYIIAIERRSDFHCIIAVPDNNKDPLVRNIFQSVEPHLAYTNNNIFLANGGFLKKVCFK